MNKEKINAGIDSAAEQAHETIDLLAGKIDAATRCAQETSEELKDRMKKGVLKAADRVEATVSHAADRVREQVKDK